MITGSKQVWNHQLEDLITFKWDTWSCNMDMSHSSHYWAILSNKCTGVLYQQNWDCTQPAKMRFEAVHMTGCVKLIYNKEWLYHSTKHGTNLTINITAWCSQHCKHICRTRQICSFWSQFHLFASLLHVIKRYFQETLMVYGSSHYNYLSPATATALVMLLFTASWL